MGDAHFAQIKNPGLFGPAGIRVGAGEGVNDELEIVGAVSGMALHIGIEAFNVQFLHTYAPLEPGKGLQLGLQARGIQQGVSVLPLEVKPF